MSHRIELTNRMVIVQLATPDGTKFRLIQQNADPLEAGELLDETDNALEILHAAERFQQ